MENHPLKSIADYLAGRILEQGSLSAYCLAIVGAWSPELPAPAKTAIIVAATYKFLARG